MRRPRKSPTRSFGCGLGHHPGHAGHPLRPGAPESLPLSLRGFSALFPQGTPLVDSVLPDRAAGGQCVPARLAVLRYYLCAAGGVLPAGTGWSSGRSGREEIQARRGASLFLHRQYGVADCVLQDPGGAEDGYVGDGAEIKLVLPLTGLRPPSPTAGEGLIYPSP